MYIFNDNTVGGTSEIEGSSTSSLPVLTPSQESHNRFDAVSLHTLQTPLHSPLHFHNSCIQGGYIVQCKVELRTEFLVHECVSK